MRLAWKLMRAKTRGEEIENEDGNEDIGEKKRPITKTLTYESQMGATKHDLFEPGNKFPRQHFSQYNRCTRHTENRFIVLQTNK